MKSFRTSKGLQRPYYTDEQIDRMCSEALVQTGFLPKEPDKVRIDRFIEKRFNNVPIIYEPLASQVLGFSEFGPSGVEAIHIADRGGQRTRAEDRRVNSTLAHEAGHCLMHSHLFLAEFDHGRLFANDPDVSSQRVLCRDGNNPTGSQRRYDGRWWELQANRAIGGLLMPRETFLEFITPFLEKRGTFGVGVLPDNQRDEVIRAAADVFDVNPAVARIRTDSFFPREGGQLTL
jgi:hypothetical protein